MPTNVSTTILQGTAGTPALSLVGGDTLNLSASGFILAYGSGSTGVNAAGSNVFNISGSVISTQSTGIDGFGRTTFNIGATATIFGLSNGIVVQGGGGNTISNAGNIGSGFLYALWLEGNDNNVSNSGNIISGDGIAVAFFSGGSTLTNSGYISGGGSSGSRALLVPGGNNTVVNTGTLTGAVAVDFDGGAGVDALFNAGTMIGTVGLGYDGSDGRDIIVNNGLIKGVGAAIDLSGGNDVYDGRNGTVTGFVLGGDGDDVIYGGIGGETLMGGNNNDQIFGGGGVDSILGDAGADLIYGGAGGDIIRGGFGGDLIGFNVGDNGDLIQFFNLGGVRDGFDLRGYFNATGYTGTTPRAAGIMAVLQNGADTDVYLHGAFAFRIQGVVAAAIDDTYFLFQ